MINTILSRLFNPRGYVVEYKAKPSHILLSVLIMGSGATSLFYSGWIIFGILTILLGFLLGLSIIICMNWEKVITYWETINEHITLMERSKNPDLWPALGYTHVPDKVQVIENEDKGQGFITTRIKELSLSPAKMNQVANKVLGTGNTEFTEELYGALIPNFRKFRKEWIKEGKLVPKNKKNVKNGYVLSRKGLQIMYEFASDNIKLKKEE